MTKKSSKPTLPRKKSKPGKQKKVLRHKKECLRRQREAVRAENERQEAIRKAEIERLEAIKREAERAENERLEAIRRAEIERLESIRLAEIEAKRAEEVRLETIRLAEIEAIRAEEERLETIRLAEIEAIRVEKEWNEAIGRVGRDYEVESVRNQEEDGDLEVTGVDRLSDLPNSVLHHILIHLPVKDAAETRALSSKWPGVWATCPILCFNEVYFGANLYALHHTRNQHQHQDADQDEAADEDADQAADEDADQAADEEADQAADEDADAHQEADEYMYEYEYEDDLPKRQAFKVFLDESLCKLKNSKVKYTLDHFGLRGASFDEDSSNLFHDWVDFALEHKLKQLDLGLRMIGDRPDHFLPFRLGNNVFTSKSLTELYLEFCKVCPSCSIDLPSLRKLSLSEVDFSFSEVDFNKVNQYPFRNLISGCPLLEDLILTPCYGLSRIDASIPNLVSLKINLSGLNVRIESPKLQSVEFRGEYNRPYVSFVNNIKDMTLKDLTLSFNDLNYIVSASSSLENLVVEGCWKLEGIKVVSRSLRDIVISRCKEVSWVNLNVPNLVSLKYSGSKTFSFSSSESLELVIAKITLDPVEISSDWFVGLKNLLQGLAGCKSLTMVCRDMQQVMSFPFELFLELTPLVRELKHLNLETGSSSHSFSDIAKGLVWVLLDLETLTIKKGSIQATIKCSEAATSGNAMQID